MVGVFVDFLISFIFFSFVSFPCYLLFLFLAIFCFISLLSFLALLVLLLLLFFTQKIVSTLLGFLSLLFFHPMQYVPQFVNMDVTAFTNITDEQLQHMV